MIKASPGKISRGDTATSKAKEELHRGYRKNTKTSEKKKIFCLLIYASSLERPVSIRDMLPVTTGLKAIVLLKKINKKHNIRLSPDRKRIH